MAMRRKLDPGLIQSMKSRKKENLSVIIYYHDEQACKRNIEKMGGKIKKELSLIKGYAAEIPQEQLMNLAALEQIEYIASDGSVKTQADIGPIR